VKLIKISIITLAILFSFQFVKAQSISIGASFGYAYPRHRVIVAESYPVYYPAPVYYERRAYYGGPRRYYVSRNYCGPRYYRSHSRHFYGHHRW